MSSTTNSQNDVIAFLSQPESYGLATGTVERRETHGAIVFLAGDRAYKLKRAVRYPYMDYSTPERRKAMCERELAVNRPTAPELYLRVQPIVCRANGELRFGTETDGRILDWVVVMRRFSEENLLERMRRAGRITPELARVLGDTVAAFHAAAEMHTDFGGAAGIQAVVAENTEIFESLAGRPFPREKVERIAQLSNAWLDRLRTTLDRRRDEGHVRRCHGDLHLNNICLIGGKPVLFDAIEFSEAFACIDTMYDLAFLLMDFDRHGLRVHANAVLNRYLEKTGDYGGLAPLPLFLSCRAAIRAHVEATAAGVTGDEARFAEAITLLDRAIGYLEPPPPRLVAVGGVSGTGKSTLARLIAPMLGPAPGAVVVRSDVLRKQLMSVEETERLPPAAYTPEVTFKVYAALHDFARRILRSGQAAIVDAVQARPEEQADIEAIAVRAGVRFDGLWLEAPSSILESRISARRGDASDATVDVLRRQLEFAQPPANWERVDVSRSASEIASDLRIRLNLPDAESR